MHSFKQKYTMIMESGKTITWTGQASSYKQGEYLAKEFAKNEAGESIHAFYLVP